MKDIDNKIIYPNSYKAMIEFKNELLQNPTPSEIKFRRYLDLAEINYKFQHLFIFNSGKNWFILDFYIEQDGKKYVFEIDGGYHNKPDQIKKDKERDRKISSYDIKVIRIKNKDVNQEYVFNLFKELKLLDSLKALFLIRLKQTNHRDKKKKAKPQNNLHINYSDWEKVLKENRVEQFKKIWLSKLSPVFTIEDKGDYYRVNNKGTYYLYYPKLDHLVVERTSTLKGKGMKYMVSRFNRRVK